MHENVSILPSRELFRLILSPVDKNFLRSNENMKS